MEHLKASDHAPHHQSHTETSREHLLASSRANHTAHHAAHNAPEGRSENVRYDASGHVASLHVDAAHLYGSSHHTSEGHRTDQNEHGPAGHQPLQGVDVYWRNGHIDWTKLKAHKVDFAFIKASEGADLKDRAFQRNWLETRNAGIVHGAYHIFRPQKSVQSQVHNFVSSVGHLRPGDLPPVLDLEPSRAWSRGSVKENTNKVLAWLQGVEHRLGIRPMIYVNSSIIRNDLGADRRLAQYPLWYAHPQTRRPASPRPFDHYPVLQYTWNGHVPGARTKIDRDLYFGSRSQLERGELA